MSYNVITISREYGAGGRSVGRLVAEKMGYKFYDDELLAKIAAETGLATDFIKENSEYSTLGNLLGPVFNGMSLCDASSVNDTVWSVQCQIIRDLAEEGKCVIIGHCADYILRERNDVLNIFLHADLEHRIKRVIEVYGEDDQKPEKRLAKKDKMRATHYRYHTDAEWGMSKNYQLSLDTGAIGFEKCAEIIADLAK